MTEPEGPFWLLRLKDLHRRAGAPSPRVLARDAGLSHTTVYHVFRGDDTPNENTLEKLLGALTNNQEAKNSIWASYHQEVPEKASKANTSVNIQRPTHADAVNLAQAINRLAAAIEYHTETAHRDHH